MSKLHTYDELFKEFETTGLDKFGYPENFVPEKFKSVLYFYWDGGTWANMAVLECMLNGWFFKMETFMKTQKNIPLKGKFNDLFRIWKTTQNIIDDGTSEELFFGIIENAKNRKETWENERKRKAGNKSLRNMHIFSASDYSLWVYVDKA